MNPGIQTADTARRDTLRIAAGFDVARRDLFGTLLRLRAGRVWLTQHGDTRDYVVSAGDAVRIDCDGTVVIHALAAAEIDVERATLRQGPAAAVLLLLRRAWRFVHPTPRACLR